MGAWAMDSANFKIADGLEAYLDAFPQRCPHFTEILHIVSDLSEVASSSNRSSSPRGAACSSSSAASSSSAPPPPPPPLPLVPVVEENGSDDSDSSMSADDLKRKAVEKINDELEESGSEE